MPMTTIRLSSITLRPLRCPSIKYRDVLQYLEALLDYEHKYRIKLPLERTISQSCMDQIQSRFNISPKQFHGSSLAQILTYLSTICTPSTRQEIITFLTMYSGSLCNVTKVPTASNISYFVHALQDHRSFLSIHEQFKLCRSTVLRRTHQACG